MRFHEFSPDKLPTLSKIEKGDLKLLWHSDYWDGPKSGLLSYQGSKYRFQVFDEPDNATTFRRFLIIELSPEQLGEEEHWHDLFRQKVGTHTDYDESGTRQFAMLRPQEMWQEFYGAYSNRRPQDFSVNRLIGWFEY